LTDNEDVTEGEIKENWCFNLIKIGMPKINKEGMKKSLD
jgi:hypothetical protein